MNNLIICLQAKDMGCSSLSKKACQQCERFRCDALCYECRQSEQISHFHFNLLFCGLPSFLVSIFFNLTILISALFDPIITLGTCCSVVLPASKNLLSCYGSYAAECQDPTKLNGRSQTKLTKQCRAAFSCLMCWLPMLVSTLLMIPALPLGLLSDLFLWIFSKGAMRLALSSINVGIIKSNCSLYGNMVQGENETENFSDYQVPDSTKSFICMLEQV